jgi:hypothetical protein
MTRRRDSVKDRRECFDKWKRTDHLGRVVLDCHLCNGKYGVILPAKESWEADHVTPHAWDGTDIRPAHPHCHGEKTKLDVTAIAKGKRIRDRHFGIKRPKGFHKPKGAKFDWSRGRYTREENETMTEPSEPADSTVK